MEKHACSAASVYSQCKDSLYICLALLLMCCKTPLGITSGAVSDWAAWLQTFHERESRAAGWSSLMRQEKPTVEAKQRSHPRLPRGVPSLFRVKLWSYLRPMGLKGMLKLTPTPLPAHWLRLSWLYSNLSDNMKPCDPFVQIVIAESVFGHFPWCRLKGFVSNNVGTCMSHSHTHTHTY